MDFEHLANPMTLFVDKPHFAAWRTIRFIVGVVLNSGLIGGFQVFDEYSCALERRLDKMKGNDPT